jgi:hypothetical protein
MPRKVLVFETTLASTRKFRIQVLHADEVIHPKLFFSLTYFISFLTTNINVPRDILCMFLSAIDVHFLYKDCGYFISFSVFCTNDGSLA